MTVMAKQAAGLAKGDAVLVPLFDAGLVQPNDLLTVQRYMRRAPMERLRRLRYDLSKDEVLAGFWKRGDVVPVRMSVAQFLRRLAGSDGRQGSLRVSYAGIYALDDLERRSAAFARLGEGRREQIDAAAARLQERTGR